MGSSFIKDQNIQIFLKLNKQYYHAGQTVQGEIYLRVRKPTNLYTKLIVGIQGEEYVYWTNRQFNVKYIYQNRHKSYSSFFLVKDFNGDMLEQGDYVFGFGCLLPAMMTGSFYYSNQCYIKYGIKAQLVSSIQPEKRSQISQKNLNIIENPKKPQGPVSRTHAVYSKCCGCCMDYGIVSATMNCDKNLIMSGDKVQVTGCLDNTRGKKTIQARIVLERIRFKVSSGGEKRRNIEQSFIFPLQSTALPGTSTNFNTIIQIPDNLDKCTAIGRFIANYYLLNLYTNYGCCTSRANPWAHLVLHSRTPIILINNPIPQMPGWSPKKMPKVTCNNLKPFNYLPDPNLPTQVQEATRVMDTKAVGTVPKPKQMSPVKQTANSKPKPKPNKTPQKNQNKEVPPKVQEEQLNETDRQINQDVMTEEPMKPMKQEE